MYGILGAAAPPPPPKKTPLPTTSASDLPIETRRACGAAVQAHQYPNMYACYDAVRGGAPVPTAVAPVSPEAQALSHRTLYIGLGIAGAVVLVGGYLLFRGHD